MSEPNKKRRRIYYLLYAETEPKFLCLPYTKQRKNLLQKKSFLRKKRSWAGNKKTKNKKFFNCSHYSDEEETHKVNKYANELEVYEKTVWTAI